MAAVQVLQCSRSEVDTFLRGEILGEKFHELFGAIEETNSKNKSLKKKKVRKLKKTKEQEKNAREKSPEDHDITTTSIELHGNASAFNVYASVRQHVLQQCLRDTAKLYRLANQDTQSGSDSEEDMDERTRDAIIKIPKIVGLGLSGVFELIRETRLKYPELCVKALRALLDLSQGQQPEGMKTEPPEVVENLYNLLMEIATSSSSSQSGKVQEETSLACSALISLTIALGDTGKLLTAVSALLMNPASIASQEIKVPGILSSLQKSVHSVLLGKCQLPDWFNQGVKKKALTQSFTLDTLKKDKTYVERNAVASDGCYLYILNKQGLFKVGSGYGGTVMGHIYNSKEDFPVDDNTWLAFAGGKLLCRMDKWATTSLFVVNRETLKTENSYVLEGSNTGPMVLFSDGETVGQVAPDKDDCFVVRTYSMDKTPLTVTHEIPLKLTRKCMDMFGSNSNDMEIGRRSLITGFDEDTAGIVTGKEFSLIRTMGGKVLYNGRASSLGIKQSAPSPNKWTELPITKSPKITQISMGHEGQHALMVAEDGSLFFVGTAKRGEDGESSLSKGRKAPKAVKPKKMIKLESKTIVYSACNTGSSAVISKEGEVYMFGKDTTHCDHSTGHVSELKDVFITQIALGKAHAVALTNKGQIYTFGINNKGQCGRDYTPGASREAIPSQNVTMAEEEEDNDAEDNLCPAGKHHWKHDQCMVCSVCGECTGYGVSCVNSGRADKNPGMPCGCGSGDSGCSDCGACRVCAGEKLELEELDERGLLEVFSKDKELLPLDIIIGRHVARPIEQMGRRWEQKVELRRAQQKLAREKRQKDGGADQDTEYTKLVSLPPAEITVDNGEIPVTQIACGLHHTVLLLQNGDVYTFGNNSSGQLGVGDMTVRGTPTKLQLPLPATQIAAGSTHTVILLTSGEVYTCGNYPGAIGRVRSEYVKNKAYATSPFNTLPAPISAVGARCGRRATWIGASGDQTFMRIDESLINAHTLSKSNVFASSTCIGLIPKGEDHAGLMKCLMISKVDGGCKSFSGNEQVDLSQQAVCLDPVNDVLWGYSSATQELQCYNVLSTDARDLRLIDQGYCHIFSPELAVPTRMGCKASRSHCALHILGCLDTLTIARQLNIQVAEETKEKQTTTKVYSKEDFSVLNRFESHGGGWGYSGHSIEAIRFMCDTDVLIGGLGLFGGRGEYFGRIKLFELGVDGGENEIDGEQLAETEEMPYECGPREKYAVLFDEPILIQANVWYVAWARISGPSSDCGSSGQSTVTTEEQVVFKFKGSNKSNNGTDVNAGQIPQILYRLPSRDGPSVIRRTEHIEPAHILSEDFSHSVSPTCFDSLLRLLDWAWNVFHTAVSDIDNLKGASHTAAVHDLQRLVYICRASLRLLKIYVNEIYSDGVSKKKNSMETTELAEKIGNARDVLKRILAEEINPTKFEVFLSEPEGMTEFKEQREDILNECHKTFSSCFHAFYPTGTLKWWCLCDLLCRTEPMLKKKKGSIKSLPNAGGVGRLLAAVMEAMCHPAIKLTNIMPINCEPEAEEILRRHSLCMDDNTNSAARMGEMHKYPILASHMSYRMEVDTVAGGGHISFKEVLDRLLMIVTLPVRLTLNKDVFDFPQSLVVNTCALLSTIISELAATATGLEMVDFTTSSRPLLVTPNRFTRTSQSPFWNTGNGSPDAVAFTVDRPGILIAGVCVYGGGGNYTYEVELLDEQPEVRGAELSHTQRWNTVETVRGSYTPEDCVNDIAEIRFDRPVPIKEGVKYAVKLKNRGSRTLNGDGGKTKVKCSDGTTFTFTACSLSSNGSNHMRGQIPQILYYSAPQEGESHQQSSKNLAELQARKNAIDITGAICIIATDLLHRAQGLAGDDVSEILGKSHLFSSLLPLALAYVGPVASQDPRGAVQVLYLIQDILPAVAAITKQMANPMINSSSTFDSSITEQGSCTTSQHYAVVESDHPYKPASVANYKVEFPPSVKWLAIEFDPQCGTAQTEDSLQLYVPACNQDTTLLSSNGSMENINPKITHWPLLKKFYGNNNWPKLSVILPGNEVLFSLETASDYVKDEKACFYGFKCTVIGYEWTAKPEESILQLEKELAYLGGMCAAALMKKDISLPPVNMEENEEELENIEEGAQLVFDCHSSLLDKGFALSQPPTIMQALEGNLPFCWQSNERAFLKDFVSCTPGTSGGRLARWLQPDSYLDPKKCEIVCNKEELKCSWPAVITIMNKDQYGQLVNVPNLKVEVKAVPVDQKEGVDDSKKMRRLSRPDDGDLTFGGLPAPCLDVPYEVVVRERKDVFHSITMMKAYENYSFEELRYAAPAVPRPSENMLVRANTDGTYSANWTPGCVGFYDIHVTIDGFEAGDVYKVEVKEPPQGVTPPPQSIKKHHQPSRMRRFVAKYSAGLRIRIHPTLQSEQCGTIPPDGVISFIDEMHNDDGVWVRLSPDSIKDWCENGYTEAWCLQYNQHLGKTLLVPLDEPKFLEEMVKEDILRKIPDFNRDAGTRAPRGPGVYQCVKCGSYGHNIRTRPSFKAAAIGMVTLGEKIIAMDEEINQDGVWVKLDPDSIDNYCFNKETEAWTLVCDNENSVFLQHESDVSDTADADPFCFNSLPQTVQRGFDFSGAQHGAAFGGGFGTRLEAVGKARSLPASGFAFGHLVGASGAPSLAFGQFPGGATSSSFSSNRGLAAAGPDSSTISRRISHTTPGSGAGPFTSTPMVPRRNSMPSVKEKHGFDSARFRLLATGMEDIPKELQGVAVKELVKALGESRANGNGPTPNSSPPGSPKRTSRSSSPKLKSESVSSSRSQSPSVKSEVKDSHNNKEETYKTPPSSPLPTKHRGKLQRENSIERPSISPAGTPPPAPAIRKDGVVMLRPDDTGSSVDALIQLPIPTSSTVKYTAVARADSPQRIRSGSPQLSSSGSRSNSPSHISGAFNIGTASPKEDPIRLSPKAARKDRGRTLRSKRERAASPSPRETTPVARARAPSIIHEAREAVQEALSPSVAECMRAVFAAFMWHEGIVHDAMACATCLKFHPDLTKEMSKSKTKKEEKPRTRHSTDSSKDKKEKKKENINESRVRFNLDPQFPPSQESFWQPMERSSMSSRFMLERHKSDGSQVLADLKAMASPKKEDSMDDGMQLPPTLQHLVYFWEDLAGSVIRVVKQDLILPSPALTIREKKVTEKKDKDKDKENKRKKRKEGKVGGKGMLFGEAVAGMFGGQHGAAGNAAAGGERESTCELCDGVFPHPVTYHMRQVHPGCGRHACGKGYNSGGNFCGGWAGNCGEGGIGGSSWYLMCDRCRDKYLRDKKQIQKDKEKEKAKKVKKKPVVVKQNTTIVTPQEAHVILKNNAMFLLDLASASGFTLPKNISKKNGHTSADIYLPSVSENVSAESEPFPAIPCQFLITQGAPNADTAFAEDIFIDDEERVFVRSGSLSCAPKQTSYRPRLPTEPRHSPLARSGSLGQDVRPFSQINPPIAKLFQDGANLKAPAHSPQPKSAGTSPDTEADGSAKKLFHRSISEITSEDENHHNDRNRTVKPRRRNNSGGVGDGGMSLLKHPSAAMTRLISSVDSNSSGMGELRLQRPVMEFIIQRHDLDGLQWAMRQALRKSACRVFAMQAYNWLLRSVIQPSCIHDLLWFMVVSLMPPPIEEEEEEDKEGKDIKEEKNAREALIRRLMRRDQEDSPLCDHPLEDISLAGKAVAPLPEVFHTLLQSISDIMMHLPSASALQRMAVCCYSIKFQQSDHQFLHESHVFSNISCILTKSEEDTDDNSIDISQVQVCFRVSALKDLTSNTEMKASSRQAMIASLNDNTTETFWESGDEDRNKVKVLTVICSNKTEPSSVYIHIDNSRDIQNKVSSMTINAGTAVEDLHKIRTFELESRHIGWVSCSIPDTNYRHIQIELKGPDQSLRVRQVKVLGTLEDEDCYLPVKKTAADLQQLNCEAETLRVFRNLTSQVFGKLIFNDLMMFKGDQGETDLVDGDNDLKEHMVGILFSRSKLSHLQRQVCSHIVQGFRKETARIREEWEHSLANKDEKLEDNRGSDVYCFELLSMVLALSGSTVGRNYLAQQYGLIQALFSLLHTATPRIQRQVISVLRRVLPEVKPQVLANILSIPALPPADYSIISVSSKDEEKERDFNPDVPGILDVFLACISKALTVQGKVKTAGPSKGVTTYNLADSLGNQADRNRFRWWLRGEMSSGLANSVMTLIQDMATGKFSDMWAVVTKAAIAEAILNLTKLDEVLRTPEMCIKTPTLWLALASLCVLDKDHVERLSSGEWISSPDAQHGQPRPTCDNHDDNVTAAIILCTECGNLCADCDRYLHLHRKTRNHQRQVFKEEEEAIKVDLHEGCGRTKLFWVMALADSKTLKAMVEFREGKVSSASMGPGTCRFCGATSKTGVLAIGNVCSDPECEERAKLACTKTLPCHHACGGIKNETTCLPCLHGCKNEGQEQLKQDGDDMCMICFTEALSAAPAIKLKCGHVFHLQCSRTVLEKKWVGPRITFGFSMCPICKSNIDHVVLKELLDPIRELFDDVKRKALMRLEYEGLHKAEAITTPGARFYKDPAGFSMDRYAYYVCYKCKKAYYGGEARCDEQAGGGEDYDPKELVCGGCSDVASAQMCPKHGTDFLEYKCRYCCSVAVFFCFGTTHFCNACHDDFHRVTNIPKSELPHCPAGPRCKQLEGEECPLHVQHPPTGEEFALGCGVCRNAHTF
ncbi:hypothetical protein SNE40_016020 [Patella caerulea]|uniref:RCR-type E3 ubiquitin transferase n=1 Tax=Patella caerulea TaxID=87958 RepID=A0AAN8JBE9_PATCE